MWTLHPAGLLALALGLGLGAAGCGKAKGPGEAPAESFEDWAKKNELPPPEVIDPADAPGHKLRHWAPAEHKKGAARWKDTAVYVDGVPVGVLAFGELPLALRPRWVEEEVSAPKKYGSKDPGYRIVRQRRYRLVEYLAAVGVPVATIRELHLQGPKSSDTLVVTGAELAAGGEELLFRFGGEVWGKVIPVVPAGLGNGRTPDKVSAVMVYVAKKPPSVVRNEGLVLDGEVIDGVPYYGEPMRGGVRVYLDDHLRVVIKRRLLDEAPPAAAGSAPGRWGLLAFLEAQGVSTKEVVEGWIIRGERRQERLDRRALASAYFEAGTQAKGEVSLGPLGIAANAIALHTRAIAPAELPEIQPGEDGPRDDGSSKE